jgi:hypothetical protein
MMTNGCGTYPEIDKNSMELEGSNVLVTVNIVTTIRLHIVLKK